MSADDGVPPGPATGGDGPGTTGRDQSGRVAGTDPERTGPTGIRWRDQAIAVGWLVLVWNLLWGEFTWGNLLGGLLVAGAVLVFFPLPPVTFAGRLRPRALLVFCVRFAVELVSASAHVARIAVQPGYRPRSAIIAVPLRVRTDLNLTLTAEVLSLVPGTLIVEVDRDAGILYVHVLDVRGPADLAACRERIHGVEERIVRAVGSDAELRRVRTEPVERGTEP